jgi:integrase
MPTILTTLTQEFVDSLALPVGKADMFRFDSDPALRGFAIRIRIDRRGRTVKKYLVCYKNEDGSQRRRNIGDAARMSATAARLKARSWLAKAADGNDPAGIKDKNRKADALRFERAVSLYLELKETKLSASSHRHTALYLRGPYFSQLHNLPVAKIVRSDVAACLNAIEANNGVPSAGGARAILSTFFSWCMSQGHCEANPVVGTEAFKNVNRERHLTDDELLKVWNAASKATDYHRIIRLLILTGCRREEIGGLRWSEIDFDRGTITLPKERTKNGCSASKTALKDGVEGWTVHDLRHTMRTGLGTRLLLSRSPP